MPPFDPAKKPLKPTEFAEKQLLEAILNNLYGPGDILPAERVLARSLGVTRPTLRETLQRLSREGWLTIAQGKPTRVNDYLSSGGLGVLKTLSQFNHHLTPEIITHLLEVRTLILPGVAQKAAMANPKAILTYLDKGIDLQTEAAAFAVHDWELQMLMVEITQNSVLKMMFNDFSPVYYRLGQLYFNNEITRKMSMEYYESLHKALTHKEPSIHNLVKKTMATAQTFWQEL